MNWQTLVVIFVICVIVGFIVRSMIKDHKKGKHICGGDCSKCHGCNHSL